ncbi:MAG TPA: VCBS repeat-containing protein, partial [Sphingomicrobium sp.]|nr:VCBS repeat-containing protein [Sphingomicrobium sp.]
NGGFVQNNANAASAVPIAWQVAGTGDFNGDGRDDILWRNENGTVSNWLGTAAGGFTPNDANAARFVPTAWHVAGTGDFNGDGRDDILWRNDNGQVSNWLGQANGGFILNDAIALSSVPTAWFVAGTGDFNGDGRDDILWRNNDGTLSNWLGQANGGFVANDVNAAAFVPISWTVVATGDYNGDGRDDILWRNSDGTLSNWLVTAAGGFTPNDANAAAPVPTSWHVQPEPFLL